MNRTLDFPRHPRAATTRRLVVATFALAALSPWARAEGARASVPPLPLYQQECASCHIAYPPGLLPAASWQRLMGGLARHFDTDASLDAAGTRAITAWLTGHAEADRHLRDTPPQDRITRSRWFLREHDEVRPATWKLPAVKSAANCGACHTQADKGDFDEHRIRIPR